MFALASRTDECYTFGTASFIVNYSGTDVQLTGFQEVAAVPEPSTLLLLALGGGVGWLRRRRG